MDELIGIAGRVDDVVGAENHLRGMPAWPCTVYSILSTPMLIIFKA